MLEVLCTDLFCSDQAVANLAAGNVGEVVVAYGVVGDNHVAVTCVAAGCQNNALGGVNDQLCAVVAFADCADNLALCVNHQFLQCGVILDFAAQVVFVVQSQRYGNFAALTVGLTAAAGRVVYTPGLQGNVDCFNVQNFEVGLENAVLLVGLGGVQLQFVPGLVHDDFFIALDGSFDGAQPVNGLVQMVNQIAGLGAIHQIAAAVAHFHQIVIGHVSIVINALLLLCLGVTSQQLAAGTSGGTAGNALLFNQQNLCAAQSCFDCSSQTACAAACNQNVNGDFFVNVCGQLGAVLCLQSSDVFVGCACCLQSSNNSLHQCCAGGISTQNGGNVQRLVFHDPLGIQFDGGGVQTPSDAADFLVLANNNCFDFVFAYSNGYGQLATIAATDAFIGTGGKCHSNSSS